MSDSYQAIYDAARSKIRNGDVGQAVSEVARQMLDISHVTPLAIEAIGIIRYEMTRPSVLFRPRISLDGNKWCALYGENLQEGVAGFGNSPEAACCEFDNAWLLNRAT